MRVGAMFDDMGGMERLRRASDGEVVVQALDCPWSPAKVYTACRAFVDGRGSQSAPVTVFSSGFFRVRTRWFATSGRPSVLVSPRPLSIRNSHLVY
jgi:hypothetical protein